MIITIEMYFIGLLCIAMLVSFVYLFAQNQLRRREINKCVSAIETLASAFREAEIVDPEQIKKGEP